MIEAVLFIGAVIAGVTQLFKKLRDKDYSGVIVISVAVLVGLVVALVDTMIGVQDVSIAQGIMLGFGAVGVVAVVEKI